MDKRSSDDPAIGWGEQRRPYPSGFTLVELMVVLAVLALAATLVILTSPSGGGTAREEADRLAVRIATLRDLAIVESQPMAVMVTPSGYSFERRTMAGWEPLSGKGFAQHDWPTGLRMTGQTSVRIAFDSAGLTSAPVQISLTDGSSRASLRLATSGEVQRDE